MVKHTKNPLIAAVLSLLIPGLGQIWINYMRRGIILFIVFAISSAASSISVQSGLISANYWIILPGFIALVAAWDSYKLAKGQPAPLDFMETH